MLIGFRNAIRVGSGKKISARSYIQDGLFAMWDGIENAGWGVHDANATVWTDLSGNGKNWTLRSAGASFRDDCLYCNGSTWAAQQSILPLVYTIECLSQTVSGRVIFIGNCQATSSAGSGCVQGFISGSSLNFLETAWTYPTQTTLAYPIINVREKHLLSVSYQYYNEYSLIPKYSYIDGGLAGSLVNSGNRWGRRNAYASLGGASRRYNLLVERVDLLSPPLLPRADRRGDSAQLQDRPQAIQHAVGE